MDEAEQSTRQSDAMTANTKAAASNTEAITHLTEELRNFMSEIRLRLVGQDGMIHSHETRISRLENGHGRSRSAPYETTREKEQ